MTYTSSPQREEYTETVVGKKTRLLLDYKRGTLTLVDPSVRRFE